ncbi:MAG: NUDIX domain-containing protein [Actinomycetaceae bacterium]|nr:NUDIX domain-containing protein [Actinomycetaceae bacterium]
MRSAGSLVWRPRKSGVRFNVGDVIDPDKIEVLIVHRPRYDDWSWPKGKAEPNEPLLSTAAREVEEETGVVVQMHAPLTTQRYRLGSGQIKEVHYWIGTPASRESVIRSRPPVAAASAKEIDSARWVAPKLARKMLTRRGDRRLLDDLVSRAEKGSLVTATVAILRHAEAVSRTDWKKSEADRPLGRSGGLQSLDLVSMLSALGTTRLLSSPWLRCTATLGPYAAVAGLNTITAEELTEANAAISPKAATRVVKRLVKRPGGPIVICSHRPVLPSMIKAFKKYSTSQIVRQLPTSAPYLDTAQFLVAHIAYNADKPQIIAVETHRTIKR